jgi:hypothetical protein
MKHRSAPPHDPSLDPGASAGPDSRHPGRIRAFVRLLVRWPGILVPIIPGTLVVIGILVSVSGRASEETGPSVLDPASERIEVQVLNGSGEKYLARRVTDFLRAGGFDVVEMGNADRQDLPETLVLDRSGKEDRARRVAGALGLLPERVALRIDPSLFLDVTVIIGRDYRTLVPFGSHTVQEEHR